MSTLKKTIVILLIAVMALASTSCGGDVSDMVDSFAAKAPAIEEVESQATTADFEVRMLDVGQGLAILIKSGDKYLLYDGGGRYTSSYVVSYLKKHGIEELEYMIASHYDEDHIFGLVGVLHTTKVNLALTPDYTTDTEVYASFRNMLASSKASEVHPSQGDSYELGDATIDIIGPKYYGHSDENDDSIAVRVSYGDFSVVITGDSSSDVEQDIMRSNGDIASTLYVVGHHGSSHSSSRLFLNRLAPAYAFISVGADNSYGHPADDTLKRLKDVDCKIFRTDLNGEVSAFYDGKSIWFETEKNIEEKTEASTAANSTSDADSDTKATYVLNTNTRKFHYPTCHSVADMAEHNKQYSESTRDELIEQGYSPCGNCRP